MPPIILAIIITLLIGGVVGVIVLKQKNKTNKEVISVPTLTPTRTPRPDEQVQTPDPAEQVVTSIDCEGTWSPCTSECETR
jgi:hypothetical protein